MNNKQIFKFTAIAIGVLVLVNLFLYFAFTSDLDISKTYKLLLWASAILVFSLAVHFAGVMKSTIMPYKPWIITLAIFILVGTFTLGPLTKDIINPAIQSGGKFPAEVILLIDSSANSDSEILEFQKNWANSSELSLEEVQAKGDFYHATVVEDGEINVVYSKQESIREGEEITISCSDRCGNIQIGETYKAVLFTNYEQPFISVWDLGEPHSLTPRQEKTRTKALANLPFVILASSPFGVLLGLPFSYIYVIIFFSLGIVGLAIILIGLLIAYIGVRGIIKRKAILFILVLAQYLVLIGAMIHDAGLFPNW